jgi:hypothetical protein
MRWIAIFIAMIVTLGPMLACTSGSLPSPNQACREDATCHGRVQP